MMRLIPFLLCLIMLPACSGTYTKDYESYTAAYAQAAAAAKAEAQQRHQAEQDQINNIVKAAEGCELDACREHIGSMAAIAVIVGNMQAAQRNNSTPLPAPPQVTRSQGLDALLSLGTLAINNAGLAYSAYTALQGNRSDNDALVGIVGHQAATTQSLGNILGYQIGQGFDALGAAAAAPGVGGDQYIVGGGFGTVDNTGAINNTGGTLHQGDAWTNTGRINSDDNTTIDNSNNNSNNADNSDNSTTIDNSNNNSNNPDNSDNSTAPQPGAVQPGPPQGR